MDLEKYITVGDLNKYIKGVMESNSNLQNVYLKGEISNFKAHTRGHWYFTLKDKFSRISAVMFSSYAKNIKIIETVPCTIIGWRISANHDCKKSASKTGCSSCR